VGEGEEGGCEGVFCVGEEFQKHGQVTLVMGEEDGDVFPRRQWEGGDEGIFFQLPVPTALKKV
jgi:hypothetical protein